MSDTPHPVLKSLRLSDEGATRAFAGRLAQVVRRDDVLLLEGPLGAGKTALARSLVRALTRADEEVPSPTFTLVQTYEAEPDMAVWHFDLYRITDSHDILELGWDEALDAGLVIVEWPDRLGPLRPETALEVTLAPDPADPGARSVTLRGPAMYWGERIDDL